MLNGRYGEKSRPAGLVIVGTHFDQKFLTDRPLFLFCHQWLLWSEQIANLFDRNRGTADFRFGL